MTMSTETPFKSRLTRSRVKLGAQAATLAVAASFVHPAASVAEPFPSRPVTVIVPYPPGGVIDPLTRILAAEIAKSTGQPFVVLNRPGATGFIGMSACAKAPPDGYTLCVTAADNITYAPFLHADMPYDPERSLVAITNIVTVSGAIYAGAQAPFNDFAEFIKTAKEKPGRLNFGTWGAGSQPDLYARNIRRELGLDFTSVAYSGAVPALSATIGNEVQASYIAVGAMLPLYRDGKIKPLVVAGSKRSASLPDVPALSEFNADPGIVSYFGLYGPKGIPSKVVNQIQGEVAKALRTPEAQQFIRAQTLEAVGDSTADFAKFLAHDRENAGRLIKGFGLKPEASPD